MPGRLLLFYIQTPYEKDQKRNAGGLFGPQFRRLNRRKSAKRPALIPSGSAGFGRQSKDCPSSASLRSALLCGHCSFRLISPPMKFIPQPQWSQLSSGEIAPFRLISALTANPPLADVRASSTGGHRRFVPRTRRLRLLDLSWRHRTLGKTNHLRLSLGGRKERSRAKEKGGYLWRKLACSQRCPAFFDGALCAP